jgi:hypoxanthine phosphoribosyltransferase
MPASRRSRAYPELDSVLISEAEIRRRVRQLGRQIRRDYGGEPITVIAIINGAILFVSDLMREMDNPMRLDCIRISSYRHATKSNGRPRVIQSLTLDVRDRHVLLIDDILDTGKTLAVVSKLVRRMRPASLRVCVLLDKKGRREVAFDADYVGFSIPNKFVVGYGLDFAERYRNLPCIGVLKPELQVAG